MNEADYEEFEKKFRENSKKVGANLYLERQPGHYQIEHDRDLEELERRHYQKERKQEKEERKKLASAYDHYERSREAEKRNSQKKPEALKERGYHAEQNLNKPPNFFGQNPYIPEPVINPGQHEYTPTYTHSPPHELHHDPSYAHLPPQRPYHPHHYNQPQLRPTGAQQYPYHSRSQIPNPMHNPASMQQHYSSQSYPQQATQFGNPAYLPPHPSAANSGAFYSNIPQQPPQTAPPIRIPQPFNSMVDYSPLGASFPPPHMPTDSGPQTPSIRRDHNY